MMTNKKDEKLVFDNQEKSDPRIYKVKKKKLKKSNCQGMQSRIKHISMTRMLI